MITLSPVGLAATALTANQVSLLVSIRERLCKPYCINSTIQPQISVVYTHGVPTLDGTTVFIPITSVVTIVTPGKGCPAITQLFTEHFTAAFQGQTTVPTTVTIASVGRFSEGSCIKCCKAFSYDLEDSITVTIA